MPACSEHSSHREWIQYPHVYVPECSENRNCREWIRYIQDNDTCLHACMLWTQQSQGMYSISIWLHAYIPACSQHSSHSEWIQYLHDYMPTYLHDLNTAVTGNEFNIYMTTCLRASMLWTQQTHGMYSISTLLHAYVPACSEHSSHMEWIQYLHDYMPTCLHALNTAITGNYFNIYMTTCLPACML